MTLQSEHPPLTWARIEQLAQAGHDDFETVTPPRARELRESVREHFGKEVQREKDRRVEHVQRNHSFNTALQRTYKELVLVNTRLDAANATLELVRYALEKVNQNGDLIDFRGRVTVALASQPEAPKEQAATPEQQEAILRRMADAELVKVRADNDSLQSRLADYQAMVDDIDPLDVLIHWRQDRTDLAAAKAKIAELEGLPDALSVATLAFEKQLDAANATLARVRAAHEAAFQHLDETGNYDGFQALRESLAGQPEAPCDSIAQAICGGVPTRVHGKPEAPCKCVGCRNGFTYCEVLDGGKPEAPDFVFATADGARHAIGVDGLSRELQPEALARIDAMSIDAVALQRCRNDLAAANARADAAEQAIDCLRQNANNAVERADAADAAEREVACLREQNSGLLEQLRLVDNRTAESFRAERDQLAARVTQLESELEQQHTLKPMQLCTPEERKVLEACDEISDHEWQKLRDDGFADAPQCALAAAWLANRAAKAKRGGA